jgi:hypothetical protein
MAIGNNQMVLQVAHPTDMTLVDPPCLRSIDTRIQNDTLHFCVYFRSWDLWGGLPANLAGIQNLKEYMATEIGVKDGEMIVESKGFAPLWICGRSCQIEMFEGLIAQNSIFFGVLGNKITSLILRIPVISMSKAFKSQAETAVGYAAIISGLQIPPIFVLG